MIFTSIAMMETDKIPTYAINLLKRPDRKESLIREFMGKDEFQLTVVPAVEHEIGSFGLWQTICNITRYAHDASLGYVLICEDDHQFTENYHADLLHHAISQAKQLDTDILCGGVSWFNTTLQIDKHLFWVDKFNATQFIVIFKRFFNKIMKADFSPGDDADFKISSLSDSILIMNPYISIQKEFGYSDVTSNNAKVGYVTDIFENSKQKLEQLASVANFYGIYKEFQSP